MWELSCLKYIKYLAFVLIILGHYYFCAYVLTEVHAMKNYECPESKTISEVKNDKKEEETKVVNSVKVSNYLAKLEIPKISLKRYLYAKDSYQNNVDKNVFVLNDSDMPDKVNGNFILAAHNGNTSVGHFKHLNQLTLNDEVIVYYNNSKYVYKVAKIYDVLKTGTVSIKRDKSLTTITLITCLGSDRQLVVIGYLK